jgi:adenylate cyclase
LNADLEKSIAVLPFTNMSGETGQDYFCEGITEDILNNLAQIEDLHVVARTSSFAFRDMNLDIREIGNRLGVHHIVEGSVRKAGNQIRITAQLINVNNGYHLWSERYDRELNDVFAVQNEIAQRIVHALEIKLSNREKQEIIKLRTENVDAYEFYVQGRIYYRQLSHSSTEHAINLFSRAIQIDTSYALAYTGLADSYSLFYMYFDRSEDHLSKALTACKKALDLDPELAEAHASRGIVLTQLGQYHEAEKEFEIATQLNPKLFNAYYLGAILLVKEDEKEEAMKWTGKALSIAPNETKVFYNAACIYSLLGEVELGLEYLGKAVDSGYASKEWIENDSDFDNIRDHPRYKEILKKLD